MENPSWSTFFNRLFSTSSFYKKRLQCKLNEIFFEQRQTKNAHQQHKYWHFQTYVYTKYLRPAIFHTSHRETQYDVLSISDNFNFIFHMHMCYSFFRKKLHNILKLWLTDTRFFFSCDAYCWQEHKNNNNNISR